MAKVTGQDIPPELADLYDKLVSQKNVNGSGNGTITTKKTATKSTSQKSERLIFLELKRAAEYIATLKHLPVGTQQRKNFVHAELERLLDGIFSPSWWIKAKVLADQNYRSRCTNVQDTTPPPYGYSNPSFKRADVTYGNGVATSNDMSTAGALSGTQWQDGDWIWRRSKYQLHKPIESGAYQPLIWWSAGAISVSASTRGSRPMFSLIIRAHITTTSSPTNGDYSPPIKPATSLYWRYKPISDTAPYYQATSDRHNAIAIWDRAKHDGSGDQDTVIIKFGPRPMMGHGFNNNNSVNTTYTGTSDLYEITHTATDETTITWTNDNYGTVAPHNADYGGDATKEIWTTTYLGRETKGIHDLLFVNTPAKNFEGTVRGDVYVKSTVYLPGVEILIRKGSIWTQVEDSIAGQKIAEGENGTQLYDKIVFYRDANYYEWEMIEWTGSDFSLDNPRPRTVTKFRQVPFAEKYPVGTRTETITWLGAFAHFRQFVHWIP